MGASCSSCTSNITTQTQTSTLEQQAAALAAPSSNPFTSFNVAIATQPHMRSRGNGAGPLGPSFYHASAALPPTAPPRHGGGGGGAGAGAGAGAATTQAPPSTASAQLAALACVSTSFLWLGRIGSGTYGTVFAGINRTTGGAVAAKVMLPDSAGAPQPHALRELRAALCARHPNVVPLRAVALLASGTVITVMPRYDASLRAVLHMHSTANSLMPLPEVRHVFACVVRGLAHAHGVGFTNRDVKPDNVLIGTTGDTTAVVLADWGLSKEMAGAASDARALTPDVITTWYAPPEVLARSRHYTPTVDTWSLGVLLAEMLRGTPLFTAAHSLSSADDRHLFIGAVLQVLGYPPLGSPEATFLERVCSVPVSMHVPTISTLHRKFRLRLTALGDDALPNGLFALMSSMLSILPERRPSLAELLRHPYVAEAAAVAVTCNRVEPPTAVSGGASSATAACSDATDTLLQLFAPEAPSQAVLTLAAHTSLPAITWARRLFATVEDACMLYMLWKDLQTFSFMAEAWLLAAYTSHALSHQSAFVDSPASARDKALALAMLAARSTALLTRAVTVTGGKAAWGHRTDLEACLLASLGGAMPPAPEWLRTLFAMGQPRALELACYMACWADAFASVTPQELLAACVLWSTTPPGTATSAASATVPSVPAALSATSLLLQRVLEHARQHGARIN